MYTRGKASFVSALATMLAVLCIIGGGAVVNCMLGRGVAWAQLSPWTDGGTFLYPTNTEDVITGGSTVANADIFLGADGSTIFNEQSNDSDFRIESDSRTSALFVDASADNIGIGTSSPSARLHIYESGSGFVVPTNTYWMIQNSGASGNGGWLGIIAGDTGKVGMWFGDSGAPEAGTIAYDNNTDNLELDAQDDIVLDGDTIDLDGGQTVKCTAADDDTYNAAVTDYYIGFAALTDNRTVNLPASAGTGRMFIVANEADTAYYVRIDPNGGETIDGGATLDVAADTAKMIVFNGTEWFSL